MSFLERIGLKTPTLSMDNLWLGTMESLTSYSALVEKYSGSEFVSAELSASRKKVLASVAHSFLEDEGDGDAEQRIGLPLLNRVGDTAIISVRGSLVPDYSWFHELVPNLVTSYEAIKDAVAIVKSSDSIKKVLLNVSSPGGSALGVDAAGKAIKDLGRTKKLVGYTDQMAASGGYWLLSNAKQIKAARMAEVGSIGVIAIYQDISKMAENAGVKFQVFTAGKYKAYGFEGTEFTDEEKEYIQSRIDKTNNFFLSTVAKNRGLKLSEKGKWADAQLFYAGEAKAVGLIDEVADLEEVLGGLNPAVTTSGGKSMTISEEKMAKISAGESPETVLTPAELEAFYDQQEAKVELSESGEALAEEQSEQGAEVKTEDPAPSLAVADSDIAFKLGCTEAKLEAAQERIEALEEDKSGLQEQVGSLKKVAQAAVSNLQVALREPKETREATADILAQYDDLKTKLSNRMPTGRVSDSRSDTQEMDLKPAAAKAPHPLRPY